MDTEVEYPVIPKNTFKKKVLQIGNKSIEYNHLYPTEASRIKLTWLERFRVFIGKPLILNLNIYLDNGKVVHTTAVLNTVEWLIDQQKKNIKKAFKEKVKKLKER